MKKSLFILLSILCSFQVFAQDTLVNHYVPFNTQNQSMWKNGSIADINWRPLDGTVVGDGWNESSSIGGITTIVGQQFGAQATAATWGRISPYLIFKLGTEQLDLNYPVDVNLNMPAARTFNKGENITIETEFIPDAANCDIIADDYEMEFSMGCEIELGFSLAAKLCFFSCANFDIVDIHIDEDYKLLEFDRNHIIVMNGSQMNVTWPYSYTDPLDITTFELNYPSLINDSVWVAPNKNLMRYANIYDPEEYIRLYFDIPKFIGALNIPYVSTFFGNLQNSWTWSGIEVGYTLFTCGFNVLDHNQQKMKFNPNIWAEMEFPTIIDYTVRTKGGSLVSSGSSDRILYRMDHDLSFDFPCNYEFMDITTTYSLSNQFTNNTYDSIAFDFTMQALEFHITVPSVTIIPEICVNLYKPCGPWYCVICKWCYWKRVCTPAVVFGGLNYSLGPLLDESYNMFAIKIPWHNETWQLGGFSTYPQAPFRLQSADYYVEITSTSDVDCYGNSSGSATAHIVNGTPPYRYEWSTGQVYYSSNTTEIMNNIPAGTHYVIISDANGCVSFTQFVIDEPALPLSLSSIVNDVDCYGNSSGTIDITVDGGTTPYDYLWSNGATTEDLSGLSQGNYSVTVTDDNGCTIVDHFVINEPTEIIVNYTTVDVLCYGGNTGSIDVNVNGGTLPYTYLWSNGATTQDVSMLTAGTYTITVTDDNACEKIVSIDIFEPADPLTLSETHIDVDCYGNNTGSIDITTFGGTPPYTYQWSDVNYNQLIVTTEDISQLTAGTYHLLVTDDNLCQDSISITIQQPDKIELSFAVTDVSCFGGNDGEIDLSVQGGIPPYTYLWSTTATTEDIVGLTAGMYYVTVSDAHSCDMIDSVYVNEPAEALSASLSITDVRCHGGNSGSIDLSVNGGTAPYSFSWSNGSTQEDLSNIGAGMYTVTITDSKGCLAYTGGMVNQPDTSIYALFDIVDASCNAYRDGSIALQIYGGTTPYRLTWDDTSYVINTSFEIYDNLASGVYHVIISDINNCSQDYTFVVNQPDSLLITYNTSIVNCYDGNDGSIDITVTGGTTPYIYSWSNGATTEDISMLTSGIYQVEVEDSMGCKASESIFLGQFPEIIVDYEITPLSCKDQEDAAIDLSIIGGTQNYVFNWSNGEFTEDIANLASGYYNVVVTDDNGCTKSIDFFIDQSFEPCLFIPSSFSPNADGINDVWVLRNIDRYPNCEVLVFNRWGKKVFESISYTEPWDGTYKGNAVPAETYYYIIDLNNGDEPYNGTVTIVR